MSSASIQLLENLCEDPLFCSFFDIFLDRGDFEPDSENGFEEDFEEHNTIEVLAGGGDGSVVVSWSHPALGGATPILRLDCIGHPAGIEARSLEDYLRLLCPGEVALDGQVWSDAQIESFLEIGFQGVTTVAQCRAHFVDYRRQAEAVLGPWTKNHRRLVGGTKRMERVLDEQFPDC